MRYGRYLDPISRRPCAPEHLIEHLADLRRRGWPLRRALLWQHVSWAARRAGLQPRPRTPEAQSLLSSGG